MVLLSYPCTFPGCKSVFDSKNELIRHKGLAPEHEYCKKCDLDFADYDEFLLHKVESDKHIVCPMCGKDFKSQGGRDIHIRNMHKADQRLSCVGCRTIFHRAATLISHIEKGECRVISSNKFELQRIKKDIMKAAVQAIDDDDNLSMISGDGSADGGIMIPGTRKPNEMHLTELCTTQGQSAKASTKKKEKESAIFSGYSANPEIHFPRLGAANFRQSRKEQLDMLTGDLEEMSINNNIPVMQTQTGQPTMPSTKLSSTDPVDDETEPTSTMAGSKWTGNSDVKLFQKSNINNWASTVAEAVDEGDPVGLAGRFNNVIPEEDSQRWNPYEFNNSITGEFECPHRFCKRTYKSAREFEEHLLSAAHTGATIRCPACLRLFKTAAALMSHCENSTVRCKINKSANYRQIIDQISGGAVEADGHFADGTVRYVAPQQVYW